MVHGRGEVSSPVSKEGVMTNYGKVLPEDKYNQKLMNNVHPANWENPEPKDRYNLVVIGAGTAGLVSAIGAAGLGGRVALIERHLMGGDCLNVGCVPSKALIRSARAAAEIKNAKVFGIEAPEAKVDFPAVMERVRRIRAQISSNDSAPRYRDLGVDMFIGEGKFAGPDTIIVGDKTLKFKKAVIATGARAIEPKIPGLAEAGFLTNETVFSLTEQPKRLAVIGAGPIGCELAQTFQNLGTQVVLLHNKGHILDREDADAAEIVQKAFVRDGVQLIFDMKIVKVEKKEHSKLLTYEQNGKQEQVEVDEILVGAGRAPNVEGLNLETMKIQYDARKGVQVNDQLQTSNPRVYAVGDVAMAYKFTHAADAAAKLLIQNTLFGGKKKLSSLTVPWATYTHPEIAHVGLYPDQAKAKGLEIETWVRDLKEVDRAIADGEDEGFVKIHTKKGSDEIVGATIVASHAGDMISEISVAMAAKFGLGSLYYVIHPYPTQAEAIKQTAGKYMHTKLTPFVKKLFAKWLAWTR
jgi:pyruvate/2-oxoglutarate dehydrogenase complex dihydrolipoamide dehydrogenase (E3) component